VPDQTEGGGEAGEVDPLSGLEQDERGGEFDLIDEQRGTVFAAQIGRQAHEVERRTRDR
jgi:hypothetical protein